jgi:glutathione peroxidase
MFEKIVVKGEGQHPLYHTLTRAQPKPVGTEGNPMYDRLAERGMGPQAPGDVLWNFEKFLVSRNGDVVARFAPTLTPDDPQVVEAIEAELAKG